MANKRRKKKPRSRKPWELGSEGEETSDGSSSEKVCVFISNRMKAKKIQLLPQMTKRITVLVSI